MVVPDLHELLLALVDIREVVDHLARLQLQPVRVRPRTDEKIKYLKNKCSGAAPPSLTDLILPISGAPALAPTTAPT